MVFDGHPTTATASTISHTMAGGLAKPILPSSMAVQYSIRGKDAVTLHFQRKAFRLAPP
ncbi:hypothetical protein COMA2_30244 [Candidatus Nitrospira nitrificans]|uniref:Uncharacterized protein n=1 Tax=Candidatus Nitrospira nitrificans TaxID=1742973 RepID=A0A0S4LIP1_9BACT|nr:hypothetical protein COMA2_30244 [Candidatus Nitrospira nitrificans]